MVVPYLRKWKDWPLHYVLDSCYHMDLCWFVVRLRVYVIIIIYIIYDICVNTGFNSIRVKKNKQTWIWWLYIDFKQARSMFVAPEALRSVVLPSFKWFLILSPDWIPIFLSSFQFNDCSQVLTLWITVCMRQLGHKEDPIGLPMSYDMLCQGTTWSRGQLEYKHFSPVHKLTNQGLEEKHSM